MRPARSSGDVVRIVAKIGTSSLTDEDGRVDVAAVAKLCAETAKLRADGHDVLIVSSGAVAAGMPFLGLTERPRDPLTLHAVAAVGQSRLVQVYNDRLSGHGLVAGQVLVSPYDFFERTLYLQAKATLGRLLELGVVPVVNENDALADAGSALRRQRPHRRPARPPRRRRPAGAPHRHRPASSPPIPRLDAEASLIEEILEVDRALREVAAGGAGSARGSGGMASKLAAARIAAWSGVRTVIAAADRDGVLHDARRGRRRGGHGGAAPHEAARGPQAVDRLRPARHRAWSWSTPGPAGRWRSATRRCCRWGSPRCGASSPPVTRSS